MVSLQGGVVVSLQEGVAEEEEAVALVQEEVRGCLPQFVVCSETSPIDHLYGAITCL